MTRPTARVLALLEVLQSGGTHTVSELADRLAVDERTVRRYVEHLRDLDVPVRSVRGRYGGYRLGPGFRMPPLMLTDDEAVAVVVGLLRGGAGPSTDSATAKVQRVLPDAVRDRVRVLVETADVIRRPGDLPAGRVLLALADAARRHRLVEIEHTSGPGHASVRTIEPEGLVGHDDRWYVVAHDRLRHEQRTFRVDRISRADVLEEGFEPRPEEGPEESAVELLARSLRRAPRGHRVSVLVRGTVDQVREALPETVAEVEEVAAGLRVTWWAESLAWVPGVLARLDADVSVEGPEELRTLLRQTADRLVRAADA